MTPDEIHRAIQANGHKWSVALNVYRVPTVGEVYETMGRLADLATETGSRVETGGIMAMPDPMGSGEVSFTYTGG